MGKLTRAIDRWTLFMAYAAGVFMCLGIVLVVTEVVVRTFFHSTIYVSVEYSGYFMVALTFLGMAYAFREKAHIRMGFLLKISKKESIRLLIDLYTLLVGLVFFSIVTYITFKFFMNSVENVTRSVQITRTYLAIPQFSIVLGSALVVMQLVSEILKRIMQFRNPGASGPEEADTLEANL